MSAAVVRVVTAWTAHYTDPIAVRAGDPVTVGRADDEYPGWRWCTGPDGREGWMLEALLDRTVEPARARVDYDARELSVVVGDELEVVETRAGWIRGRAADGAVGWIPETHVGT